MAANERNTNHDGAGTRRPALRWARTLVLGLLVASIPSGCMYRRMTIRSNPPGALVIVDGKEVGFTPHSMDFTYYGTHEVTLIKDGYETLTVETPVNAPWYQQPGIDFFADNLLPYKVTNRHEFAYNLRPQVVVPNQELLDRANQLRSQSQVGQ